MMHDGWQANLEKYHPVMQVLMHAHLSPSKRRENRKQQQLELRLGGCVLTETQTE